jgi:hypothetical protein
MSDFSSPSAYIGDLISEKLPQVIGVFIVVLILTLICVIIGLSTEGPHVRNSLIAASVFLSLCLGFLVIAGTVAYTAQKIRLKIETMKATGTSAQTKATVLKGIEIKIEKAKKSLKNGETSSKRLDGLITLKTNVESTARNDSVPPPEGLLNDLDEPSIATVSKADKGYYY